MTQLDKDSKTLGMIAAGLAPREKLAETTRSIAKGAKDSLADFEPIVPGGRAKPGVWSNRADFMQRLRDFATRAEAMDRLGAAGNLDGVKDVMVDALPCKSCHDIYREPKKP